jgi:hypothetical protein
MRIFRDLAAVLPLSLVLACGGHTAPLGPEDGGGVALDGGPATGEGGAGANGGGSTGPLPKSAKVDVLFMIDNSASMGDKQVLLAAAVPDIIQGLVSLQVHDMHIGVVTSSLGGRGGDQCDPSMTNPANPSLNAHNDDRGELIDRAGVPGDPTVENPAPGENTSHFLSWFPSDPGNQGQPAPLPPAITDADQLVGDFQALIEGVHEHGCGFEAQNEAWYRFLGQPDPFDQIVKNGTYAHCQGVDATILRQRHDFLRPDSLLLVLVVTDENEEAADPLSISGQGWAFNNQNFPGSPNGAAPEGSIECQQQDLDNPTTTGPNDPNCTSCAFISGDPNFATRCPKDGNNGELGYLDPIDDTLNTRYFHQKVRFGLSSAYPTSRYVRALTKPTVPDAAHEHDDEGNYVGDEDANANCTNPIFAQDLPTDPTADLCALTRGPRTPGLVLYGAIAGVPHQLLQENPADPDSPQKATLTEADWTLILGKDPERYDFRGADFHMIEDWNPRTTQGVYANASTCPPGSPNDCDPINGREWSTNKGDLQFACIFDLRPLYGSAGKDCTNPEYLGACNCAVGALNAATQLCDPAVPTRQLYGKAYPSVREMIIAHALGEQGIVSSLCPIHMTEQSPGDPLYGYRPAVLALLARIAKGVVP